MPVKDKYDGISIGDLVSERWLERNAVLSRMLGKGYFPAYDPTLDAQTTPGVKKIENDPDGLDESKVYIIVGAYNPNGGLDVNDQDQHTEIIDLLLSLLVQEITIAVNTNLYDTTVTITSLAEPINGNIVCLKEGVAFYQGTILSHLANGSDWDIILDTPLDFPFTVAGGCSERDSNLAGKVGTLAVPVIFSVSPGDLVAGTKWDINRTNISITSPTAMDDAKFGGIVALPNGVVFRSVNGITKNVYNVKSNGEFALRAFDVVYSDKAPAGSNGVRVRKTNNGKDKSGVAIRLLADTNDEIQVLIQDSLVGLDIFKIVVQGHVVQ